MRTDTPRPGPWKRRVLAGIAAAAAALGAAACRQEYNIDLASARSGLRVEDLKVGGGMEVREGSVIEAHYVGRLPDGTAVVDTRTRGKPHRWTVGDHTVIAGMDKGVIGMREGGKREILMTPAWHYGKDGHGTAIPPNTSLTFEVEMISVRSG